MEKTIDLTINLNMMKYFMKISKEFSQTLDEKDCIEFFLEKTREKIQKAHERKSLSYCLNKLL